jgi:TonB family protein
LGAIFVSYRRSDSQGEAGRLFDDLITHFGDDRVFMDVAGIEAGRDFRKVIEEGIAKCGVLLVVMGPAWVTATDEHGTRRLEDPKDFVRIEVAAALTRDIPVIPVLVRGAQMPHVEDLPECLKEFAYRNCVELTHARWRSDVQLLLDPLRRLIGGSGAVMAAKIQDAPQEVSAAPQREEVIQPQIDPAALQRITRELALHIGPIAELVVKRAAPAATGPEDLCQKVAKEIDSPQAREKFLQTFASPRAFASTSSASRPSIPPVTERAKTSETRATTPIIQPGDSVAIAPEVAPRPAGRKGLLLFAVGGGLVLLLVAGKFLLPGKGTTPPENWKTSQQPANITEPATAKKSADTAVPSAPQKPLTPAGDAPKTSQSSPIHTDSPVLKPLAQRPHLSPEDATALLLHKVVPEYPPLAHQAHIQGAVVLKADISREGTIENLQMISGHPMLVPAAIEAVKQWRYKPYAPTGQPTPFETQVTVNFSLQNR